MHWFDYAAPRALREALDLYAAHPNARLLAGGTDLIPQLRAGRRHPDLVIDIKRIPEMNELRFDPSEGLTMGAALPCCRLYESGIVLQHYPSIAEVAGIIGGTPIQGRASLGGNLCNSSPSADSVPLLIALEAQALLASSTGTRTVPVDRFCTAPGKNVLTPGEMLVAFCIAPPKPRTAAHYLRFIPRNEMDIAVAGAGVSVTLENGHIGSARVALAAVGPTPILVNAATAALEGQEPSPEALDRAAECARDAASPITDMRGTADYRRHLCAVLTRRALEAAIRKAKESH